MGQGTPNGRKEVSALGTEEMLETASAVSEDWRYVLGIGTGRMQAYDRIGKMIVDVVGESVTLRIMMLPILEYIDSEMTTDERLMRVCEREALRQVELEKKGKGT